MTYYTDFKITNLDNISKKDQKAIQTAIHQAKFSNFKSSKRLGAFLRVKGQCILWGEST
tara:strand:- start:2550 stop:2726 length:177 start_codon:yes stop_codon:yes gene_type:complete